MQITEFLAENGFKQSNTNATMGLTFYKRSHTNSLTETVAVKTDGSWDYTFEGSQSAAVGVPQLV